MITKFKIFEEDRYMSDDDIESGYNDYNIISCEVKNIDEEGGASGYIDIEFPNSEDKSDSWIKYGYNKKIAFDNWYPDNIYYELCDHIEKCIKEEKIKRAGNKFNL